MKACYTPTRSHVLGKQADTRAGPVGRSSLKGSKLRACRKEAPRAGTGRHAEPEEARPSEQGSQPCPPPGPLLSGRIQSAAPAVSQCGVP